MLLGCKTTTNKQTDFSGKDPHRKVCVGRVVISGTIGGVMISILAQNARDVGSIPLLDAIFPNFITPTTPTQLGSHTLCDNWTLKTIDLGIENPIYFILKKIKNQLIFTMSATIYIENDAKMRTAGILTETFIADTTINRIHVNIPASCTAGFRGRKPLWRKACWDCLPRSKLGRE